MAWNDENRRKTFQTWSDMKQRCYNQKHKQYPNYGGRGIGVCDSWKGSFQNFLDDMGIRPDGMTLDRINNNGNYSPENCRWATASEQCSNQRRNVTITFNGETLTVTEWGKRIGRHPTTIFSRLKAGWRTEDILDPNIQARGRCSAPREYAAMKGEKW